MRPFEGKLLFAGIALSLAGIAIVSLASLVWPEMQSSTHHHNGLLGSAELPEALVTSTGLLAKEGVKGIVTGILLTLLSMLILAMRLVSEEFALQGSKMHSLQVAADPSSISAHNLANLRKDD